MRLIQTLNIVQIIGGYPVEPVDLHPNTRHPDCLRDFVTMTEQAVPRLLAGLGPDPDGIEIARIGRHRPRVSWRRALALHRHQLELALASRRSMAAGIIEMAGAGQAVTGDPSRWPAPWAP